MVGGLLGHAKKAQEAAEAMRKAQDAYIRSVQDTVAALGVGLSETQKASAKIVKDVQKSVSDWVANFGNT